MTKKEIRKAIKTVYRALRDVLALYDITDSYNKMPGEESDRDAVEYLNEKLRDVRCFVLARLRGEDELKNKLLQVVDETKSFVNQCEVPGVVLRWKQINPRIQYFDAAFCILEDAPELYKDMRMGLTPVTLACYPDEQMIAERKAYFEEKRGGRTAEECTEDDLFPEELLETLKLVFKQDFPEYI